MMTRLMSESPVSPSSLSVPVQTILCGQGAQSYFPMGIHPKISSGASTFLRFGSLSLNPHAEEFVPSSLKVESTGGNDFSSLINSTAITLEPYMERSFSSKEYRQYVCSQLPDDILPDFSCAAEDSSDYEQLHTSNVDSTSTNNEVGQTNCRNDIGYAGNMDQSVCQHSITFDASMIGSANYIPYDSTNNSAYVFKPQEAVSINQLTSPQRAMRPTLANDVAVGFYKDIMSSPILNDPESVSSQSLNVGASKFSCIRVENLADKFSSGGDHTGLILNTLSQVEEGPISCQSQLSATAVPYMSATNIPSPSSFKSATWQSSHLEDANNRPLNMDNYVNFSTSYLQHDDRRGMVRFSGSLKPSHLFGDGSSFIQDSKAYGQKGVDHDVGRDLMRRGGRQAWLEMGDTFANTFTEKRDKAPEHARMSNIYYEHARQAHLAGTLAFTKDFNATSQWHMEQITRETFKGSDIFGRQNCCFVNMGHTAYHSLPRPGNVFIH